MFRPVIIIVLSMVFLLEWWWVLPPLLLWYVYLYSGYELIVWAAIIDSYIHGFRLFPGLTIAVTTLVVFGFIIRPQFLLYTKNDEVV